MDLEMNTEKPLLNLIDLRKGKKSHDFTFNGMKLELQLQNCPRGVCLSYTTKDKFEGEEVDVLVATRHVDRPKWWQRMILRQTLKSRALTAIQRLKKEAAIVEKRCKELTLEDLNV